jgi:DNA-binding CsgD family transcriptional regulator
MTTEPWNKNPERDQRILQLSREGLSVKQISQLVGITGRSVQRTRARFRNAPAVIATPLTAAQLSFAHALLENGAPYSEVARTLGCNYTTVRRHFPGYDWTLRQCALHGVLVRRYAKPLGL